MTASERRAPAPRIALETADRSRTVHVGLRPVGTWAEQIAACRTGLDAINTITSHSHRDARRRCRSGWPLSARLAVGRALAGPAWRLHGACAAPAVRSLRQCGLPDFLSTSAAGARRRRLSVAARSSEAPSSGVVAVVVGAVAVVVCVRQLRRVVPSCRVPRAGLLPGRVEIRSDSAVLRPSGTRASRPSGS